jgi:hypothetical protein
MTGTFNQAEGGGAGGSGLPTARPRPTAARTTSAGPTSVTPYHTGGTRQWTSLLSRAPMAGAPDSRCAPEGCHGRPECPAEQHHHGWHRQFDQVGLREGHQPPQRVGEQVRGQEEQDERVSGPAGPLVQP